MEPKTKTLIFYRGEGTNGAEDRGVATVTAARLSFCSQYCDLRDEKGNLVATITWTGSMHVRELPVQPVARAAR